MHNKARERFKWHRNSSKKRGIEFQFSFEEWYNWWLSNGIDKNQPTVSTNSNTLCMCRFNDEGPYSVDNVYCATISQNSKDATPIPHDGKKKRLQTPKGIFESRIAAAQAYHLDPAAITYRVKKFPKEFYYL